MLIKLGDALRNGGVVLQEYIALCYITHMMDNRFCFKKKKKKKNVL